MHDEHQMKLKDRYSDDDNNHEHCSDPQIGRSVGWLVGWLVGRLEERLLSYAGGGFHKDGASIKMVPQPRNIRCILTQIWLFWGGWLWCFPLCVCTSRSLFKYLKIKCPNF